MRKLSNRRGRGRSVRVYIRTEEQKGVGSHLEDSLEERARRGRGGIFQSASRSGRPQSRVPDKGGVSSTSFLLIYYQIEGYEMRSSRTESKGQPARLLAEHLLDEREVKTSIGDEDAFGATTSIAQRAKRESDEKEVCLSAGVGRQMGEMEEKGGRRYKSGREDCWMGADERRWYNGRAK